MSRDGRNTAQPALGRIAPILLYVEDDRAPALLFKMVLDDHYPATQLLIARSPDEALATLRQQAPYEMASRPHLIVLDIHLGHRSGLDLLERIRKDAEFASLPAVIFSNSPDPQDRARAQELGVLDFISKPVELPEFEKCVKTIHALAA